MHEVQFTSIEFSLDQCLKCNTCTTVCPVMAVSDLFPGPKYTGPQASRFRQPAQETTSNQASVDYCSGCRACNMVCPTGVKIAEMNARARGALVEQGKVPSIQRLRNNLVARAATLGRVAQPVAPLANIIMGLKPVRWVAHHTLGIHQEAPFPPFSSERFTHWFAHRSFDHNAPIGKKKKQVVYFHGCSTEYYEPRIGKAAVHVLEKLGFEVIVPQQNCCGLPLLSNGEFTAARKYHENNVRSLVQYAQRGIPIIGTSTSCTLTLKEEAPELLDMEDKDTHLVAKSTFDFNEFVLPILQIKPPAFKHLPFRLPYHIPCQYRAHRLGKPGLEVLDLIPGLIVEDGGHTCCGIAGTYGYKVEKYAISMAVGSALFEWLKSFDGPENHHPLVICDSETCRWQITHATGIPAIHPAELLAAALNCPVEGALQQVLIHNEMQESHKKRP